MFHRDLSRGKADPAMSRRPVASVRFITDAPYLYGHFVSFDLNQVLTTCVCHGVCPVPADVIRHLNRVNTFQISAGPPKVTKSI